MTVVGGIFYWIPGSAIRFNSEMAMLLSLLMISNMIGAITILPMMIRIFKPRFVMQEHMERESKDASLAEIQPGLS
jgi:predicted RND superfamily exporter protein